MALEMQEKAVQQGTVQRRRMEEASLGGDDRLTQLQRVADGGVGGQRLMQLQSMVDGDGLESDGGLEPVQLQPVGGDTVSDLEDVRPNNTGLPDDLKAGVEALSGYSMDDVKVHYNSDKPAQLQAHAYAQGTDIHIGPGQEKYLPHEAWHVVQQKRGITRPTVQMNQGVVINENNNLEKEANAMGKRALRGIGLQTCNKQRPKCDSRVSCVVMRVKLTNGHFDVSELLGEMISDEMDGEDFGGNREAVKDKAGKFLEGVNQTYDVSDSGQYNAAKKMVWSALRFAAGQVEKPAKRAGAPQALKGKGYFQTTLGGVPGRRKVRVLGVPYFENKKRVEGVKKSIKKAGKNKKGSVVKKNKTSRFRGSKAVDVAEIVKKKWRNKSLQYKKGMGKSGDDEMVSTEAARHIVSEMASSGRNQEEIIGALLLLTQARIGTANLIFVERGQLSAHPGGLSKKPKDFRYNISEGHDSRNKHRLDAVIKIWDKLKGSNCDNWKKAIEASAVKAMALTNEIFMATPGQFATAKVGDHKDVYSSMVGGVVIGGEFTKEYDVLVGRIQKAKNMLYWKTAIRAYENRGAGRGNLTEYLGTEEVLRYKCIELASGDLLEAGKVYRKLYSP